MLAKYLTITTCLLGAFWLTGCDSCGAQQQTRDREALSLIPDDALLAGSADMDAVRRSPIYKRAIKQGNPLGQYLGECSYDPLLDVERVWFGFGLDAEQQKGSIVVFGPLDQAKVLECYRNEMRRKGLSVDESEIEGFEVHAAGPGRPHLSWIDAKTLVLGDRGHVEKMLALEKGKGKSIRSNQTLLKLYDRMAEDRDVAIAGVSNEEVTKRLERFLKGDWAPVANVKQLGIGIRFGKGMDLLVTLRLASGTDGTKIHQRVERELKSLQSNQYIDLVGLGGHLKAVNVEAAGPEITGTARWTDRQVDTIARLAVDSIDEVIRSGGNVDVLRERFEEGSSSKTKGDAGPAKVDGGPAQADGGPGKADGGPGKADGGPGKADGGSGKAGTGKAAGSSPVKAKAAPQSKIKAASKTKS